MADIVYIEQGYYQGDNYFTYTADASATLNATTTVACTVTNVKTLACDFSALFTPSLTATILKNHTAVLDVNASMQSTISKIAGNQSTLDSIVALSLQGDRGRTFDSTLPASFTQSTQIQKILNASSTATTDFAISITANKILLGQSTLNPQFTFTADGDVLGAAIEAAATLNTTVTMTVTPERFRGINITFYAQANIFTEVGKLQLGVCDFSTLFTPTVTCTVTKNHTAILDAVCSISCAITKFTSINATLNTEFAVSATVSRSRTVSVTFTVESTQTTDAQRFRGIEKTLIGEVTIFTEIGKLQLAACDFSTLFTPNVICVVTKNHTAILDAVSSLSCAIEKTVGFTSTFNTQFNLNVNIIRFRSVSATVNSVFTQTAVVGKIVQGVSTFLSTFNISNQNPSVSPNFFVGTLETAQASISSQFSLNITFITFVSKWFGYTRPNAWTFVNERADLSSFGQSYNSLRAVRPQNTSFPGYAEVFVTMENTPNSDNNAFIRDNEKFVFECWFYIEPNSETINSRQPLWLGLSNNSWVGSSNLVLNNNSDMRNRTGFSIGANFSNKLYFKGGSLELLTNQDVPKGQWFHIAIRRTVNTDQSNSLLQYYFNGSKLSQKTLTGGLNFGGYFYLTTGYDFGSGSRAVHIDNIALRARDDTIYGPSIYPPKGLHPNQFMLYDFNQGNVNNLSVELSGSASITATATMTTVAGKSTTAQATLNTQFTVSAQIGEIEPADIQMNTVCSLSVVATRIQPGTSNLNASASQSVDVSKFTGFNISLNSAVTVSNTITRIKQLFTEFSAIATELATVAKIGQGLITMDSVAQFTATVRRIASAESNQLTQFGITAQGDRTRFGTVSTQSEFSLNALNSRIRALNSSENTEFAFTAATDRIRSTVSTFSSEFTVSCEPLPIKSAQSNQSAEFTQITTVDRIRDTSVTFNSNFTQQSTGIIAVDAVADLNSEAQSSITVLRIRPGQVQMDAIAVNLTAAAKTGAGLVTIESQSQCTVSAQKITDIQLNAVSTAELTNIIERIQQGVANIQSTFTQTANGILSTDVVANMNTLFSTTVTAQKTVSVISTIASEGGFVMAAVAIRNNEILMPTQSTITVVNGRTRFVSTNLQNSITLTILAGKAAVAQCVMNTTVTQNCTAGVLRLDDIILYIKTESRTHSINNEQRSYAIREENRLYTIEE